MDVNPPDRREERRAVVWFVATCLSVFGVYTLRGGGWTPDLSREGLTDAGVFTGALMGILLAHEMGHYVVARLHGFATSPPTFIPLPIPGTFGTMGAVINLRSLPSSRAALLEMGAAGPLAGALAAFAALWYGVPRTRPGGLIRPGSDFGVYNDPAIVKLIGVWTMGEPPGRYDIYHPAALAGWVGCLLTAINLIPLGQLDGGHVLNAIRPSLARRVTPILLLAAFLGGFAFAGWWIWGLLLLALGAARSLDVPVRPPLGLRQWIVAALLILVFALTFMPVPVEVETFPG